MRFLLALLKGAIIKANQSDKKNNKDIVNLLLRNGYTSYHRCNLWDVDINMVISKKKKLSNIRN